jgi:outer membrane protein assembly factor BamB
MPRLNRYTQRIAFGLLSLLLAASILLPMLQQASASVLAQTGSPQVYLPNINYYVPPSDWNQLGANPQRTGYINYEIPTPWSVQWIWNGPAGGGNSGADTGHLRLPKDVQPIIGGGKLFVPHTDGYVRAISQTTGTVVWTSPQLGGEVINTLAYDDLTKSVYVGTRAGHFIRLDAASGQVLRTKTALGEITMAPLLSGNMVFIGSKSGIFYAFNTSTLDQQWSYNAGAALVGSTAFSGNHDGLIILLAEDRSVHAVQVANGARRWRTVVNADKDPLRGTYFANTYPVVSEVNDSVIVRSYLNWEKIWMPNAGAPTTVSEIRSFLTSNPTYQSFFVMDLNNGAIRYVAPVMLGGIGNGGDLEAPPPQAVVKTLSTGSQVAYLLWRNRASCGGYCDSREDTTLGEMDLSTGNIRFVQDHKNSGNMRLPTDEQSPLSMAGNTLLYAHWMLMGSLRITDRSSSLGGTYGNPIRTVEVYPILNTLSSSLGAGTNHFKSSAMGAPCDQFGVDAGFYVYYAGNCVYDQFWTSAVRSAVVSNGVIYLKTVDGAIIAVKTSK